MPYSICMRIALKAELRDNGCWEWMGKRDKRGYGFMYSKFAPGGSRGAREQAAHRTAYAHLRAPIPRDLELDHLCRNPACVNPWHMEPVTHAENVRRGVPYRVRVKKTHCVRGHEFDEANTRVTGARRTCRACARANVTRYRRAKPKILKGPSRRWIGSGNPRAKLTAAQAQEIKSSVETTKALMQRYGVSKSCVNRVRRGDVWVNRRT